MNARDIEIAVADYFNYRQNVIVPNVSWGLFRRQEVDLLVVRKSGYCVEVEIKVASSDIRADKRKQHSHWNHLIRQTWFAVPEKLASHPDIPAIAGVLAVIQVDGKYYCRTVRGPKVNKQAVPLRPEQMLKVGSLAAMRIWTLKAKLRRTEKSY